LAYVSQLAPGPTAWPLRLQMRHRAAANSERQPSKRVGLCRSLRSSSRPASPSPADIGHDNQLAALGPMLSTSDRFRFFGKKSPMGGSRSPRPVPTVGWSDGRAPAARFGRALTGRGRASAARACLRVPLGDHYSDVERGRPQADLRQQRRRSRLCGQCLNRDTFGTLLSALMANTLILRGVLTQARR
jgi:hypothetical protein